MPKKGGKKGGKGGKKAPPPPPLPPRQLPPPPPLRDMDLPIHVMHAAEEGKVSVVLSWLDDRSILGHPDAVCSGGHPKGQTMLMAASLYGRLSVVIGLLNRGARLDLQDANGNTALMLAARRRMCGYGTHDDCDRCARELLSHGANPNCATPLGISPCNFINPNFNAAAFRQRRAAPSFSMVTITPIQPMGGTPAYRTAPRVPIPNTPPPRLRRPPSYLALGLGRGQTSSEADLVSAIPKL